MKSVLSGRVEAIMQQGRPWPAGHNERVLLQVGYLDIYKVGGVDKVELWHRSVVCLAAVLFSSPISPLA